MIEPKRSGSAPRARPMRTIRRHASMMILAGALAAFGGSGLEDALLGSWGVPDGDRFTFSRGGVMVFGNPFVSFQGEYRIAEGNIVEMNLRDPFGGPPERMHFRARVVEGGLELCPPGAPGAACNLWPRVQERD